MKVEVEKVVLDTMTGQQYLARALHKYGITHVFMVPTSFVAASAEMDRLGMRVITTHGEKAAVYMADGYARARNAPGVCHAQAIGAANLAAGLRDPFMAGSPVIALTGGRDPLSSYRHVYQEIEDFPLFNQVTKANVQLHDVRRLPDLLRQLFRDATTGAPGPVHLEVDGLAGSILDAQLDVSLTMHEDTFGRVPALRSLPPDEDLVRAIDRIRCAERPVLIAGGGVKWSGAGAELRAFAQALGVPVATSMNGKGLMDERGELSVGVVGSYSRSSANRLVMEADLVCFVGSHCGSQVTDNWRLPVAGTEVIQIDVDPSELGRNYPNSVSLCGDAKLVLDRMTNLATERTPAGAAGWADKARSYVEEWREENRSYLEADASPMRPERICAEVERALDDDAILVSDTGHAGIWTASMIDLKPGQSFLRCAGSLGWAFPAALGAKCGAPDRQVVCFTGDGGLYYHIAELETAVRYGIPAVIVVNDNRSLSQDLQPYRRVYDWSPTEMGEKLWMFEDVNLADVAKSFGCQSYRAETPNELVEALKDARNAGGPVLIDAVSDYNALPQPPFGGRSFYATAKSK